MLEIVSRTALAEAAEDGRLEGIQALLENRRLTKTSFFSSWFSPAHPADHEHTSLPFWYMIVEALLEVVVAGMLFTSCSNIDINQTDQHGRTPLFWACSKGNLQMVEYLLSAAETLPEEDKQEKKHNNNNIKKADANLADHRGVTPLLEAVSGGHLAITELLLQHHDDGGGAGVDVNHADRGGGTALWWAAFKGHIRIVQLLLNHGANVNQVGYDGRTPLASVVHWRRRRDDWQVLMPLLEHNARIDLAFPSLLLARPSKKTDEHESGAEHDDVGRAGVFLLDWLAQDPTRTLLSLKDLQKELQHHVVVEDTTKQQRKQNDITRQVLEHFNWIVAFLWFHYYFCCRGFLGQEDGRESPRPPAPPLIEDTAFFSDQAFKATYKWMIHSASSLLSRDNRILRELCRMYDPSVALEECQRTNRIPLLTALENFPDQTNRTEQELELATAGIELLMEFNPLSVKQPVREKGGCCDRPKTSKERRTLLAFAMERSLPSSIIRKMITCWPASVQKRDPATGLCVFLLAAKHYTLSEIYSFSRDFLPDMLAQMSKR